MSKSGLRCLLIRFQTAFAVCLVVFLFGCSQTKDTFINRNCHNLSAHYNGYYNAGLKIDEGKAKLAELHTDAYDRVLRVFPYASVEKAKQVYPQMDDAIKRLSTSISKHTMYDKHGNEKPSSEHWIDDNWILYGQAMFFKHEYFQAMDAFVYVEATYKNDPGRFLASMWIAKTYLELTQLDLAEDKLDYLRNTPDFPKRNRWELEATQADYFVQVHNNAKAIEHLQRAAILAPKREDRIRFLFILAQLNQKEEHFPEAFKIYSKVIKMNPKYEMDFNARINRARCFDATSGGGEQVKRELERLKNDPKNKDYLDQIYFALSGIAKKEGRSDEEVELLNKSIQSSTNNNNNTNNNTTIDFTINITEAAYASLNTTVGFYVDKTKNIIIAKTLSNEFIAVSSLCTQQQATVDFQANNNRFYCSAHGSTFSTTGAVINGPAAVALKQYKTTLTGNNLRIYS